MSEITVSRPFTRRRMLFLMGAAAFAKVRNVELGVCSGAENFSKAEHYGFDYFEPGAAAISAMSETAFANFREQVAASKLKCRSFNSLIRTLKVVGPEADPDAVSGYLETTLERCRQLGAKVAVLGSASSRNVPEGYSREKAWAEIRTFLARAGDIAKTKGMVVAIEPLRRQESNILNTGGEALKMVEEVKHPQVKMIIDYYHLRVEQEDPEIVRRARQHIVHMHFANPAGRKWPHSADEDPVYAKFFEILKQVDYSGGLSIEGSGTFEQDAAASLAFFRSELA